MKLILKNKGVIIFYLIIIFSSLIVVGGFPNHELQSEDTNLLVKNN